jgi:hypothetical protein
MKLAALDEAPPTAEVRACGGGGGGGPVRRARWLRAPASADACRSPPRAPTQAAAALDADARVAAAASACCRIPALRHTPVRELLRLARHLTAVAFQPGESAAPAAGPGLCACSGQSAQPRATGA